MNMILRLAVALFASLGLLGLFMIVLPTSAARHASPEAAIVLDVLEDELKSGGDCSLGKMIGAANDNTLVEAYLSGNAVTADTIAFCLVGTREITPGLLINGHVTLVDGSGLADVSIYRSYSAYPGELVATTDQDGFYQSDFAYIPGDENISIWAEREGYFFDPNIYYWRHYIGYEVRTLNFTALPSWKLFIPFAAGVD